MLPVIPVPARSTSAWQGPILSMVERQKVIHANPVWLLLVMDYEMDIG
jgi:hypothetical protein